MNTTAKTALTIMFCFIVALVIILTFTIYHILEKGDEEIKKYRDEEIGRVRQSLRDYVDIAYATIEVNYQNARDKAFLEKYYGRSSKNMVEVAENILQSKAQAVEQGELTLQEAQTQATAEISQLRYDKGNGYIWIIDTTSPYPKMIMHAADPSLNDQMMDDPKYNVALGKGQNLYLAAAELSQQHGKGFIDYLWAKTTPDGVIPDVQMLAYVKLFQDWKWVIGTSVYVDEAIDDAIEKSQRDIRQMRYNNGEGYFWISSANKSNLQMIVHPDMPSLEGKILEGKLKNLHQAFIETCENQGGSGFKDNMVPKTTADGRTIEAPKKYYVKLYEPLDWVIGTGVYVDSIELAVAEKQALVKEQINDLILKLVLASIFVVLLISILSYIMSQYFPLEKPQRPSVTKKPQPTPVPQRAPISMADQIAMKQELPGTYSTAAMLPANECMKMIQEISKTLIAEQSKLLVATIGHLPQPMMSQSDEHEFKVNELKQATEQLASQNSQTLADLKKWADAKQQSPNQPAPVGTVEIGKYNNKVMNNLNNMVS